MHHSGKSLLLCKQLVTMSFPLILQLANKPSAIAIEPTVGHKAAVLTLLVQLPFGDSEFAPSGQSGMAVGSALVCIGECMRTEVCFLFGDGKFALGLSVELKHCKKRLETNYDRVETEGQLETTSDRSNK